MSSKGERRMVFETGGRRKHVLRVVYAILALLMGGSLFLTVGPFNLSELGGGSSGSSATEVFHEQAERIEGRLAKTPKDEQLLLALTRARINAGNSQIETTSETEVPTLTADARDDFDAASQAWTRYVRQADAEVSASAAQLVAGTFFRLAESTNSVLEAQENVAEATKAQRIAVEQSPSLGSLSTLAIYEYFNGEFAVADKTAKRAAAKAPSKAEAKNVEKQLAEYRKRSQPFNEQKKQLAKVQSEVGKEQLQNPLGAGVGGSLGE
jgi:hypothetical protein